MTNEEINRYIHTEIMGKCWHDVKGGTFRPVTCKNGCGLAVSIALWNASGQRVNPDYCSDASPRSLLREVLQKITPSLTLSCGCDELAKAESLTETMFDVMNLSAEQIARACVEAHKGAKR